MQEPDRHRPLAPVVAVALALAYPAAVAVGPAALAVVTVAASVAACALVLARRPTAGLRIALGAVAYLLRAHPVRGLAWVLAVLYALPLPLIPWLYARTFPGSHVHPFAGSTMTEEQGSRGAEEQQRDLP